MCFYLSHPRLVGVQQQVISARRLQAVDSIVGYWTRSGTLRAGNRCQGDFVWVFAETRRVCDSFGRHVGALARPSYMTCSQLVTLGCCGLRVLHIEFPLLLTWTYWSPQYLGLKAQVPRLFFHSNLHRKTSCGNVGVLVCGVWRYLSRGHPPWRSFLARFTPTSSEPMLSHDSTVAPTHGGRFMLRANE